MATTYPYTTPYARARTSTQVRKPARLNTNLVLFTLSCITAVLLIAFIQLWLADQATSMLRAVNRLGTENSLLEAQMDEMQSRIEELGTPRNIEGAASRLGLKAVVVEFGP